MTQTATGWNNTVNSNGCSITWSVDRNATTLFGTDIPSCTPEPLPQFAPVIIWFFTYQPQAQASATICSPKISLIDVTASIDIATSNLTNVVELRPFSPSSNFSSFAGNITGPPLNGRAYNGIRFNLTNPDEFVLGRNAALQLQLPAAVFQAAVQSPQGLAGSFDANAFTSLATTVYRLYLSLVARNVYLLPHQENFTVEVRTFKERVWLSDIAVHLLTAAMLLLALAATIIQLSHRLDRRHLKLKHQPGTIASAVSIGAQTEMGQLLAGLQHGRDIDRKLREDRKSVV